jgi:hypothetical protein
MCHCIVGTMSLDIYIYITCPVAMPRIVELLQIVEEKRQSSDFKMNISMLSSFPKYKSQIQRMMIPSVLFAFFHVAQELPKCPSAT